MKATSVSLIGLLVLTGCGGSGGSTSSPTSPQPTPTSPLTPAVTPTDSGTGYAFFAQQDVQSGQSMGMAMTAAAGRRFATSNWRQTGGPEVVSLANHTQVIGFETTEAGDYTFEFSGQLDNGVTVNQVYSFAVEQSSSASTNVRVDHAAVETSKVSLRVDGDPAKSITSISWEQTGGPNVDNLEEQEHYLFFDAPAVSADDIVEFVATIRYDDGSTGADSAFVVIQDVVVNANGYFPSTEISNQIVTTDMLVYNSDSPYSQGLLNCVYNNQVDRSCSFSQLPLIGQVTETPTIDDIMDRVLVSHPWMGDRFKQYLQESIASEDMLKLLRATTAIVISYDIRPSFYWSATGAIYLDAANFWSTAAERDTLNDQPDFRSGFGNELQFSIPWRYVRDNQNYLSGGSYPVEARLDKSFEHMEASITWLMYHELAHANDFFPPQRWSVIGTDTSPLQFANDNPPNSAAFENSFPLNSTTMSSLAQVSFFGSTASDTQKALSPSDVVAAFEPDNAPAYYSYSTELEDYATLFERFMMAYRMGVSADVAVTNTVDEGFLVSWGQRDRINIDRIQPRVRSVVGQILPDLDVASIQPQLASPILMRPGESWGDNLDLSGNSPKAQGKSATTKPVRNLDYRIGHYHVRRGKPKQ